MTDLNQKNNQSDGNGNTSVDADRSSIMSPSTSLYSKGPVDMSEVLTTAARLSFSSHDRVSPREVLSPRRKDRSDLSKEDMDILSSLPRQSVISIPSEDDRKRVLVCIVQFTTLLHFNLVALRINNWTNLFLELTRDVSQQFYLRYMIMNI